MTVEVTTDSVAYHGGHGPPGIHVHALSRLCDTLQRVSGVAKSMYAAAMTATTAEKPADLASVRRLGDPREKLRRTAQVIEETEREIEPHRLRRNAAAVIMFRRGQDVGTGEEPMQPAAMWRDTIRVSRSLWHKIMDEADPARIDELSADLHEKLVDIADLPTERAAEIVQLIRERDKVARKLDRHRVQVAAVDALQAEIDADPEVGHRLLAIAREEAATVRRLELLAEEAMKLRDEVAVPLLNGTHGTPMPNAEVARLARLSTARVAQLRNARFLG